MRNSTLMTLLQQYLPFTVLKLKTKLHKLFVVLVATVLTVYGIETFQFLQQFLFLLLGKVATVLTVYGIETIL